MMKTYSVHSFLVLVALLVAGNASAAKRESVTSSIDIRKCKDVSRDLVKDKEIIGHITMFSCAGQGGFNTLVTFEETWKILSLEKAGKETILSYEDLFPNFHQMEAMGLPSLNIEWRGDSANGKLKPDTMIFRARTYQSKMGNDRLDEMLFIVRLSGKPCVVGAVNVINATNQGLNANVLAREIADSADLEQLKCLAQSY